MPKFSPIHFMDFILHQSNNLELVLPMSCRERTTIDPPPPPTPSSPQKKKTNETHLFFVNQLDFIDHCHFGA